MSNFWIWILKPSGEWILDLKLWNQAQGIFHRGNELKCIQHQLRLKYEANIDGCKGFQGWKKHSFLPVAGYTSRIKHRLVVQNHILNFHLTLLYYLASNCSRIQTEVFHWQSPFSQQTKLLSAQKGQGIIQVLWKGKSC